MATSTPYATATSGLDLRLMRVGYGITQTALGERMGVSRRRVGNIEGQMRVAPHLVERYKKALDEELHAATASGTGAPTR